MAVAIMVHTLWIHAGMKSLRVSVNVVKGTVNKATGVSPAAGFRTRSKTTPIKSRHETLGGANAGHEGDGNEQRRHVAADVAKQPDEFFHAATFN